MPFLCKKQIVESGRILNALDKIKGERASMRDVRRIVEFALALHPNDSFEELFAKKELVIDGISCVGLNSLQMEELKDSLVNHIDTWLSWSKSEGNNEYGEASVTGEFCSATLDLNLRVVLPKAPAEMTAAERYPFLRLMWRLVKCIENAVDTSESLRMYPVYKDQSMLRIGDPLARYVMQYDDLIPYKSREREYFALQEEAEAVKQLILDKHWCQIKNITIDINPEN